MRGTSTGMIMMYACAGGVMENVGKGHFDTCTKFLTQ